MTTSRFTALQPLSLALVCGILCPYAAATEPAAPAANAAAIAADPTFGISPGSPDSLKAGIEQAHRSGVRRVVVPAGVYRLPRPENAPWHLKFSDLKNLVIDASGATLIFEGRDRRALLFDYCENVTFRGATLLRETPPFSQGKIEAIAEDRAFVDVRIDAGYPADLDDKRYFADIPVFSVYQKGTRRLKPLVPDIYLQRRERLGPDLFRFHLRAKLDPRIPVAVADPIAWRSSRGSELAIWSSAGMRLENITIKNSAAIGFMEIGGEGGHVYTGCSLTYAPPPAGATEAPLLACALDGFHSASVRKGPVIENCSFEGLNDDAINIHGTYAMVMETKGAKAVIDWRSPHTAVREPFPFARAGDAIRFYDTHGALAGEAKVVSLKELPVYAPPPLGTINSRRFSDRSAASYWEVALDRPVSAPTAGLAANTQTTGGGFVIRDCTFRDNRAHGIFIRASDGLIENNTIERTLMGGIVIAPEMNSWNESDYARNIVIRGNTLRDVGVGTQPWNSGITVAAFEYGKFVPLPGGHRDIVIRDNTFERVRGANIVLTSTIGAEIAGNRFVEPQIEPAFRLEKIGTDNDHALLWIRHAENVVVRDNVVVSPGAHLKTLVDAGDPAKARALESGVTVGK